MEGAEIPVAEEEKCQLEVVQSPKTIPILEPENWEKILSNLPPKDFLSAINSCPEWAEMMRSQTPGVLLPLILPKLAKHLPSNTLLNCRKISQQGKAITDELLERDPADAAMSLEPIHESYTFDSLEKVERFNQRMAERPFPSENPFLIPSIYVIFPPVIQERNVQEDILMQEELMLLVERFGKYVKSLEFVGLPLDFERLETLFLMLPHLPNLTTLSLNGFITNVDLEWLSSIELPPSLYWLRNLKLGKMGAVREDLPSVEALCFRLLRQCGPCLHYLSLPGDMMRVESQFSLLELNSIVPNVKILHLYNVTIATCELLKIVTWPLEVLRFLKLQPEQLVNHEENDNHANPNEEGNDDVGDADDANNEDVTAFAATVSEFLEAAANFSNTLVSLDLFPAIRVDNDVPYWLYTDFNPEKMAALPNLKTLDLEFYNVHFDWFWEFLIQSCQTLEKLSFHSPAIETISRDHVHMAATIALKLVASLEKVTVYDNVNTGGALVITCSFDRNQ